MARVHSASLAAVRLVSPATGLVPASITWKITNPRKNTWMRTRIPKYRPTGTDQVIGSDIDSGMCPVTESVRKHGGKSEAALYRQRQNPATTALGGQGRTTHFARR